ncbi:MAG: glycosyltransferase [Pseudomonadota bacterium]
MSTFAARLWGEAMSGVMLVLNNMRAEGGPQLAADLAAEWADHNPVVALLNDDATGAEGRFDALGVPVDALNVGRVTPLRYPQIARAFHRAFRRHRPKAVVSIPNGVHGAVFAGAACAGVRRRVVHMGNYPWHWQPHFRRYRAVMQAGAPLTPDLVCVTRHVEEGVRSHLGPVARRLHVIENGIDLSRFPFKGAPTPALPKTPIDVAMVGRLDPGKDHPALLEALAILMARGVAVRLHLAGDGACGEDLKRIAKALRVAECVRFLGAIDWVPELLRNAHVFAFAVQPEEGLGIALVEAMAVGTPVVASDVGACREVLDGGRCGALVPPNSPAKLADAILRAALRPDAGVVAAARRRVETTYSRAAMAAAYGELCDL